MKKLTLLLLLQMSVIAVFAQAPVSDDTWLPSAGNRYLLYKPIGIDIYKAVRSEKNDTGENITWHYENAINGNVPFDSFNFGNPNSVGLHCDNPNANFAEWGNSSYSCMQKNSSGVYYLYSKANYDISEMDSTLYKKHKVFILNNLNFHQEYFDTSIYERYISLSFSDSLYHCIDFRKSKYDGYGTLKYGNITYDSVIRLYTTILTIDSVYTDTGYIQFRNFEEISEWFVKSVHCPLLMIGVTYSLNPNNLNDTNSHIPYGYKAETSPYSTTEPIVIEGDGTVMAYFNGNAINFHGEQKLSYNLYDVQGKLITNGKLKLSENNNKGSVKVGSITPGVYILKVEDDKGNLQSIKLIKN